MPGRSVETTTAEVEAALANFTGKTIGRANPDHDSARSVYNAVIHKSPALIAQVDNEADAALAVRVAREHGRSSPSGRRPQRRRTRHP